MKVHVQARSLFVLPALLRLFRLAWARGCG
jgi:hypothetical protein